jgi:hypothetical protein
VFRYPVDITQTFVKRVVGVPAITSRSSTSRFIATAKKLTEPYVVHKNPYPDSFRDNFPNSEANLTLLDRGREMLAEQCCERRSGGAARILLRHGRQSRQFARQPLLGLRPARKHHRQAADHLLVLQCQYRKPGQFVGEQSRQPFPGSGRAFLSPRRAGIERSG